MSIKSSRYQDRVSIAPPLFCYRKLSTSQQLSCSSDMNAFYSPRRTSCLTSTKFGTHNMPPEPYFVNCKAVPTLRHLILSDHFLATILSAFMTPRRSLFRPCIDLHQGQVKQIVGGTLSDKSPDTLKTNFVARCAPSTLSIEGLTPELTRQSAGEFARIYKENDLEGGHVIKLGPGNDEAALDALSSWPGSIQPSIMVI